MQISRGIWIQESLAWPLWKHADSRRWSNAGHQNSRCFPKLLAKFRRKRKSGSQTCHALSNVSWNRRNSEICRSHDDKWMVLQWKINLVFVSITSEFKKNCDAQIKNAHCKAEKKHTNQASTFLNIRKKGMIWNLGLFFGRFSIFIQYAILKYITCFEYYIFLKRKMQVITVIYESSVPINFEFGHVYDSIIMALTFSIMF